MENYYLACSELAAIILSAVAYDLGIDSKIFEDAFKQHTSFLRLNYYPVFPKIDHKSDFLGVNRHTDAGVLTLLLQDANSALEVYRCVSVFLCVLGVLCVGACVCVIN